MRIVNTDNFGGDYPAESFLELPRMTQAHAMRVVEAINGGFEESSPRYWKVVADDYVLQPGFRE